MTRVKLWLSLGVVLALGLILACGEKEPVPKTDLGFPYFADMATAKLAASEKDQPFLLDFYTDW